MEYSIIKINQFFDIYVYFPAQRDFCAAKLKQRIEMLTSEEVGQMLGGN